MSSAVERVTSCVNRMQNAAQYIEALEAQLALAKDAYRQIETEELPELMREFGLVDITLENGLRVTVSEDVMTAITEERRAAAHAWLREHGYAGIIKCSVSTIFGVGEEAEAAALAARLNEERPTLLEEKVHPQTLRAFVRERLEAGTKMPFELFGIHPYNRAKIVAPRARKGK